MRVVIVGSPEARARLLARLPLGVEVAGEADTLAEADRGAGVDAYVIAPDASDGRRIAEGELDDANSVEALTPRELEVLGLLAQGLPNKAIAAALGISDQTVKFHVATICGKLGASNRTDAARRALRRGLIPL